MRMRKKKGWALLLAAALLTGILPVGTASVSKAEETSAPAGKYGLKNPVVKAVSPPANTSHGLSNPRNEDGTVTWDCVYFGNYWQNDTNGDGVADKNDEKEPIKWRVLSVDGDDAFLLADTNLDVRQYNDTGGTVTWEDRAVTWETCTMRSWLNGYGADKNVCEMDYSDNNFLDNAFTELEQAAIKDTVVVNEDNQVEGTEGGDDTVDKVYLLSIGEVMNLSYGFTTASYNTETRKTVNTVYVEENPIFGGIIESKGWWWLRSPDDHGYHASMVGDAGGVRSDSGILDFEMPAVRPVLHLNLSSDLNWKKAEPVSSDGGETKVTWDCIWFGNYPQSDATGVTKESIKWRVLSVNRDDAFLLADTNLDVQKYNDTDTSVTWETCMMRTWLNSRFLNRAFNLTEQVAVMDTTVVNEDNLLCGTEGGNDTVDKVYLLSIGEAMNPSYGFISTTNSTYTRGAIMTEYVIAGGR